MLARDLFYREKLYCNLFKHSDWLFNFFANHNYKKQCKVLLIKLGTVFYAVLMALGKKISGNSFCRLVPPRSYNVKLEVDTKFI